METIYHISNFVLINYDSMLITDYLIAARFSFVANSAFFGGFSQEETDTSEFFLSLDKDPLQEDFLQGRMVGNPYSSNEPGLGPLMRDVKNKICRG